jgi:hypothetical protein
VVRKAAVIAILGKMDVDAAIASLDLSLFSRIPSQTWDEEKRGLLAAQAAIRDLRGSYEYLEIGSHLGGSIQPYLVDPRCQRIYSIDRRPVLQADGRGVPYGYPGNSTARMLELLAAIDQKSITKIKTFDGDSRSIDPRQIGAPDICFIDGEHTTEAVSADWQFCLRVCRPDGVILFHDMQIVFPGIRNMIRHMRKRRIPYSSGNLGGSVYYVCLGESSPILRHPAFRSQMRGDGLFSARRDILLFVSKLYNRANSNPLGRRVLEAESRAEAWARRIGIPVPSLRDRVIR